RFHLIVDMVGHVGRSLVKPKKKLCLLGVTDDATWKRDSAVIVFVKFTSENRAHVRLEPAAIEQHLQAGRDDVMFDRNSVRMMLRAQETVEELLEHFGPAFVK